MTALEYGRISAGNSGVLMRMARSHDPECEAYRGEQHEG
jgi:hypothetical protein